MKFEVSMWLGTAASVVSLSSSGIYFDVLALRVRVDEGMK